MDPDLLPSPNRDQNASTDQLKDRQGIHSINFNSFISYRLFYSFIYLFIYLSIYLLLFYYFIEVLSLVKSTLLDLFDFNDFNWTMIGLCLGSPHYRMETVNQRIPLPLLIDSVLLVTQL